jgi:hypothetical protein
MGLTHSDNAFLTSVATNLGLATLGIGIFIVARRIPFFWRSYATRTLHIGEDPSKSFFSWMKDVHSHSDDGILRTHGVDVLIFMRFLYMCFFMCLLQMLYGVFVLFPVNTYSAKYLEDPPLGLAALSMNSIPVGSSLLWWHLLSVVYNTAIWIYFIYDFYSQYLVVRMGVLNTRTVLISGIQRYPTQALQRKINQILPNSVEEIQRYYNYPSSFKRMYHNWKQAVISLERATAKLYKSNSKNYWIDRDKITECTNKTERLRGALTTITDQHETFPSNVAFVRFNNKGIAMLFCQALLSGKWDIIGWLAPLPTDVLWKNLGTGYKWHLIRRGLVIISMAIVILFWAPPVAFLAGISNLETLDKVWGISFLLKAVEWSPILRGFLQGILPQLTIIILLALLLPFIRWMSSLEHFYSKSRRDLENMLFYFHFQLFNVLLVYTITGSIWNVFQHLAQTPKDIFPLLAASLPNQSGFFINFIMLTAFGKLIFQLVRPIPVLIHVIKRKYFCSSKRDYRKCDKPPKFPYDELYANHMLIMIIVLLYSTLSPFILCFGVIYFGVAMLTGFYNILYVYGTPYEGLGNFWPYVANRLILGLFLYQFTMLGVFSSLEFYAGTVVVLLSCLATVVFWYFLKTLVSPRGKSRPLLDSPTAVTMSWNEREEYLQPELRQHDKYEFEIQDPEPGMRGETLPLLHQEISVIVNK